MASRPARRPASDRAAESRPLNLITSPLPINLVVDPGKSATTSLRVKQNSGVDEPIKIDIQKAKGA